ncbi:MAG TPA: hypothetical protein PKE45_11885, partial [Caldilineaceae bacterium]|nr:hypothetical protein [Caldilineaceae bacterium]
NLPISSTVRAQARRQQEIELANTQQVHCEWSQSLTSQARMIHSTSVTAGVKELDSFQHLYV